MRLWILLVCFWMGSYNASPIGEPKKYCTDDKDPDFRLLVGQQGASPKGSCMLVKCEEVIDGKSRFTRIGCGVFVATPGCNMTDYDNTKHYPDCCPNEICF